MKKVYAVVHVINLPQAIENTQLAKEAGCDGVFLISHGATAIWPTFLQVRAKVPEFFLGVNDLEREPVEVLDLLRSAAGTVTFVMPDALWMDNAGIRVLRDRNTGSHVVHSYRAALLCQEFQDALPALQLFGGVAFKHQKPVVSNPHAAAVAARDLMDVVVTSGERTGSAPDLKKIQDMSEGCGKDKLGIASGITPENVEDFLPFASHFLVATGISRNFHELDRDRTQALVAAVKG